MSTPNESSMAYELEWIREVHPRHNLIPSGKRLFKKKTMDHNES